MAKCAYREHLLRQRPQLAQTCANFPRTCLRTRANLPTCANFPRTSRELAYISPRTSANFPRTSRELARTSPRTCANFLRTSRELVYILPRTYRELAFISWLPTDNFIELTSYSCMNSVTSVLMSALSALRTCLVLSLLLLPLALPLPLGNLRSPRRRHRQLVRQKGSAHASRSITGATSNEAPRPREGRIPTRGAIQRGEAAALDDDILSNITASTDACTDGSCSLAYLVRTGLGSALHYVGAAAGRCYLAQANAADPKSRKQALSIDREGWLAAEKKQLDNHKANGSWTLINRSSVEANRKLVRLIWVYKVKRSGALKARLCVQGCAQIPGVDFHQTFCATLRGTSLRLLCSLAARHGLTMRRWGFVSAYLQGELLKNEVVYCQMPPGYETVGSDGRQNVCRIEKPVYGMAQSSWPTMATHHIPVAYQPQGRVHSVCVGFVRVPSDSHGVYP